MTAWMALLRTEGTLFWRHGFFAAALALTLVWAALLHLAPSADRAYWFGWVAGLDVTAMGLLFGFGLGLLEQQQGVAAAWRLTPVPALYFTLARTVGLGLLLLASLSLLAALTLTVSTWLLRLPGLALLSFQAALIGIACGRALRSINQFIVVMTLTGPFWAIPLLGYSGWVSGLTPWLWPLGGGLYWLRDASWQAPDAAVSVTLASLLWLGVGLRLCEWAAPLNLGHRLGERR